MKTQIGAVRPGKSAPSAPPVDAVDQVDAVDPQVSAHPGAAYASIGGVPYVLIPAASVPQPEPAEPERLVLGWFRPTIIPATARLVGAVGVAVALPVYNGAALAPLFAGAVVRYCGAGATGEHATGGHVFAGFVCTAVVVWSWRLDPGPKPTGVGRHDAAKVWWNTKHFFCRVVRWSAILGSAAVPPLAAGILHITTGVK